MDKLHSSAELFSALKNPGFIIAGPCVAESDSLLDEVAGFLFEIRKRFNIEVIFKASFDKANRTSASSYRGPGMDKGLMQLADIKARYNFPITTDIHESQQAGPVGQVVDILQIPAFLCRQTDLLMEAGKTGRIVNVKKAQFLSGMDMKWAIDKVKSTGNEKIMLTERGNMFGYNNLVVDFRNVIDMKTFGYPVIMDATHSVQKPGGLDGKSGGNREYVPYMAKAAKAIGVDGYFFEIHPTPDKALSDGPNMLAFKAFERLMEELTV
jgi:2-dehydro-3-deoxyphosphooctonate aldolase (KDO 8-P synthase)